MDVFIRDVRFALRTLGKAPTFTLVTVLTLALGIGANIAIFSVVSAVLLQPLPFPHSDRLVRVFDDLPGAGARDVGMSVPEMQDLRASGVFDQFAVIFPASTALTGGDRVERVELLGTTPNYFEMLGATPALGRVYGERDALPGFFEGVVISDGLWKRQFGSDPRVIGRRIRVDEDGYTIIGVMPPGFRHPGNTLNGDVDIWAATGFIAPPFPSPPVRNFRILPGALARLKEGLSLGQAQRRLDAVASGLQRDYPNDYPAEQRWTLRLEPAQASLTGNVRPTLLILLTAVGFVLLIVCVNLANLLLARSSVRSREFAVRQALGATAGRLARQVLTESILIATAGGAVALVVLRLARTSLLALVPADIPRVTAIGTDGRVAAVGLAVALLTGILFGLVPALHASQVAPNEQLKEGGRTAAGPSARQNRSRATLVIVEVAVSAVLLTAAGLQLRSFAALLQQDPGIDPDDLTVGQVWVPVPNNPAANRYLTIAQRAGLMRSLLDQLAILPNVEHSALGTSADVPLLNTVNNSVPFSLPEETTSQPGDHAAEFGSVSPGYFATLKTPVRSGRVFTDGDDAQAPLVAVVNQAFVRTFSPQVNPVGRRIRVGPTLEFEIVGVVGDIRNNGLDLPVPPHVYLSILQRPNLNLAVFVRTKSGTAAIRQVLTTLVRTVDPELPVFSVRTMDQIRATSMARRRFALTLMTIFGLSALLVAAFGIYGVLALVVSERSQEFAVRRALGAGRRDILVLVLRPGLALAGAGTLIGLVAAIGITRVTSALIYGVTATDPITFLVVATLLVLVALAACLVPAGRAVRVPVMDALKG